MDRRKFLTAIGSMAALDVASFSAVGGEAKIRSTSNGPPRKVIVGTAMQAFWGEHPGLQKRLEQLAGIVDQMAEQAKKEYSRGPDLAVLPETALTGEAGQNALACSVPFYGLVQQVFTQKARQHN